MLQQNKNQRNAGKEVWPFAKHFSLVLIDLPSVGEWSANTEEEKTGDLSIR